MFEKINAAETLSYARKLHEIATHVTKDPRQHEVYTQGTQIALVCYLRHIASSRRVVVCNTHIACNYNHRDTQLAQVACLLSFVEERLPALPSSSSSDPPPVALLCMDANSMPSTGFYALLEEGRLPITHPDASNVDASIPSILPHLLLQQQHEGEVCYHHSLALRSAMKHVNGSEPAMTTVKGKPSDFEGCLDYIFYSSNSAEAVQALRIPPRDALKSINGGIPNGIIPSDHVPLGAVIQFK